MCVETSVLPWPASGRLSAMSLAHQPVEMRFGRLLAELVAFQPAARCRGGMVVLAGRRVAEPQDGPLALRARPTRACRRRPSCAVRSTMRSRGMTDSAGSDANLARCGGKVLRRGRRLALDVLDAGLALRRRQGQHGDVPVEIRGRPAAGQARRRNACGPSTTVSVQTTRCMDSSGVIHGPPLPHQPASLFMLTSRPRRLASLQTCWKSSRHCGPAKSAGPLRRALIDLHDQHAADAHALHRLQVGRDAFLGDVAVEPEPVDPRPGRGRRWRKSFSIAATACGGVASAAESVSAAASIRRPVARQCHARFQTIMLIGRLPFLCRTASPKDRESFRKGSDQRERTKVNRAAARIGWRPCRRVVRSAVPIPGVVALVAAGGGRPRRRDDV